MAFAQDIRAQEGRILHPLARLVRAAAERIRQHRLEQRTFRALSALSDRELDDLGLSRAQLRSVARNAARHN